MSRRRVIKTDNKVGSLDKIVQKQTTAYTTTDKKVFTSYDDAVSHQTDIDAEEDKALLSKALWIAFGLPLEYYDKKRGESPWDIRDSIDGDDLEDERDEQVSRTLNKLADKLEEIAKEYVAATDDDSLDVEDTTWEDMFPYLYKLFFEHNAFCKTIMDVFNAYESTK